MSTASHRAQTNQQRPDSSSKKSITRIAAGVDGGPRGLDAVVLGESIAAATGAELMLVTVHSEPLVVLPEQMNWESMEREAQEMLRRTRRELAPSARTRVMTDLFLARALDRVVRHERRDLVVVGSSMRGSEGRVRIGNRTRQLLDHGSCAVAVAPAGLRERGWERITRVGVGFDGGPESRAALRVAAEIARSAEAELHVQGVVDDRIHSLAWSRMATGAVIGPDFGWPATGSDRTTAEWDRVISDTAELLRGELVEAVQETGTTALTDVREGRPATVLLDLSEQIDLLVIGSRRWGTFSRLILGSTGEALLHDSNCAVLVVPRPGRDTTRGRIPRQR